MADGSDSTEPEDDTGSPPDASESEPSTLSAVAGTVGSGAQTVLGPLVASKLRIVLLLFLGLVALAGAGFFLGVLGAPEVVGVQNGFGDVSQNETVVETNVTIHNPNPIGVSLGGVTIDYDVSMNDVRMANGTKEGVSIDSGNSTMHLETVMFNDRIPPWWASHVRNGERTQVGIDAEISSSTLGQSKTFSRSTEIETDILGQFASQENRPINANHALVDDPILIVRETDAHWGSVSRNETPLNMNFAIYNPNAEPYAISELRYEVTMNDLVVSRGATEDPFVIPGGTENTLRTTTNIQNQRLDEWWVSHLNESVHGHQVSRFQIAFTAVVELPGGEEIAVPLDDLTYAEWIGTDVLGEGGDVGVPPDEDPETDDGGIIGGGSGDGSDSDGGSDDGSGGNDTDDGGDDGILGGDDGTL